MKKHKTLFLHWRPGTDAALWKLLFSISVIGDCNQCQTLNTRELGYECQELSINAGKHQRKQVQKTKDKLWMTVSINWIMSGFTIKHLQGDKKCRKKMKGGLNLDQAGLICRKSAGDFLLLQQGLRKSFRNLGVQFNEYQVTFQTTRDFKHVFHLHVQQCITHTVSINKMCRHSRKGSLIKWSEEKETQNVFVF